ncbi:MAG: hypothetical protein DYH12_03715 [Sorangiineae bacterium PRO1]|nr:hypothetical protein [Sorangiineae bacterium PRO1]
MKERIPSIAGGRLRDLEHIADGSGSARIYRATASSGELVAVKVIPRKYNSIEQRKLARYFEAEQECAGAVTHANIRMLLWCEEIEVTPELGALTPRGAFVYCYEWVEASLKQILDQRSLSTAEVLELAGGLCAALTALHESRPAYLHRDIKPANILVPRSGFAGAKLADFGIVKAVDDDVSMTVQGTERYMSPEQYRPGAALSPQSDIYALCLVLWECLTGERPMWNDDLAAYDNCRLRAEFEDRPQLVINGRRFRELESVLLAGLEPDAADRPESATELLALFEEAGQEDGLWQLEVQRSPATMSRRAWRYEDHRRKGGCLWVYADRDAEKELAGCTPGANWNYSNVRGGFFTRDPSVDAAAFGTGVAISADATAREAGSRRETDAAFLKPVIPNAALAAVVGSAPLPRSELTKKLWAYIKKNGLQDTRNRRMINADNKLLAIFGGKKQVSMFDMTKLISRNLR